MGKNLDSGFRCSAIELRILSDTTRLELATTPLSAVTLYRPAQIIYLKPGKLLLVGDFQDNLLTPARNTVMTTGKFIGKEIAHPKVFEVRPSANR
jgi:hypothetical protein